MYCLRSLPVLMVLLLSVGVVAQTPTEERAQRLQQEIDGNRDSLVLTGVTRDSAGAPIPDSLTVVALYELGMRAYNLARDERCAALLGQAAALSDRLFQYPHPLRARIRTYRTASLNYLGRNREAIDVGREAVAIYEQLSPADTSLWNTALNELARAGTALMDVRIVRSATYRSVDLVSEHTTDHGTAFEVYYGAAENLFRFGDTLRALTYAVGALRYARRENDARRVGLAYNQLAIIEHEIGNAAREFRYLKEGISATRRAGGDPFALGVLYLNLADYYGARNSYAEATDFDRRARAWLEVAQRPTEYYKSDRHPRHLHEMGRDAEALALVNAKLDSLLSPTDAGGDLVSWAGGHADLIIPRINLLTLRAELLTLADRTERALADYATLLALQEYLRTNVSSTDSRRYLSKNLRPLFDRAVALYYREYRRSNDRELLWRAFELSERARAYSLLVEVSHDRRPIGEEEQTLRGDVAQLERRVARGDTSSRARLEQQRLTLDRLVSAAAPSDTYAAAPLDRAALIAYLQREDCHLLQYNLGSELGLLFVLGPDGLLEAREIPHVARLNDRITDWRTAIEQSHFRRKSLRPREVQEGLDGNFLARGRALAKQLLPALHLRPRLCIVPDGGLHYLPFAALPLTSPTGRFSYSAIDYLGGSHTIHHAFSAAVLLEQERRAPGDYPRQLTAFAPVFATDVGEGLTPLRHNTTEVSELSALLPVNRVFTAALANRATFERELGKSAVLHLSSHGRVHPRDARLSFVAFSQSGDTLDRREMLYFNDLRHLRVDNELTVLSACETSLGELVAGETTLSFGSALAAAGSRSTVTTLWRVDDGATKELLLSLYRSLGAGRSRAAALGAAQEELRNSSDFFHPYYWSGAVLYGIPGPIEQLIVPHRNRMLPLYAGFSGLLLFSGLVGTLVYLRKRRRAVA